jgi:hypothetical protein
MTLWGIPLTDAADQSLPTIATQLGSEEIKGRLLKLSKRGKLAGYEPSCPNGLAAVAAHGAPFDSKLVLHHRDGEVSFELKMIALMPQLFVALLIVTIWPGLPLTEVFLDSFVWYTDFVAKTGIETWHWYLPLTVLPAPFAFKGAIKKSKSSAYESAIETIEKLDKVLSSK